jgi:hypothetical protein
MMAFCEELFFKDLLRRKSIVKFKTESFISHLDGSKIIVENSKLSMLL